jgi:hypothetical protein
VDLPIKNGNCPLSIAGWWFGTVEFYDFPSIGNGIIIPTDFQTHIFQRGRVETTN